MFDEQKKILPSFPRTKHLPYNPNASSNDLIATAEEAQTVFNSLVNIEEKIDGASVGICLHPELGLIIRNKDHVLRKGYHKETAAKEQFRSIWGWFYDNQNKFELINESGPYAVYGEWCVAQHGIYYGHLPDWFIGYDVYDYEVKRFLAPPIARQLLEEAGFSLPYLYMQGKFSMHDYQDLEYMANLPGKWSISTETTTNQNEGIYLKTYDDRYVVDRFKMVRNTFVRGALWNSEKIKKNKVTR